MFESEERRIVERIKDYIKNEKSAKHTIMLSDGRILDIDNYREMVDSGKINLQDAYIDIPRAWTPNLASFHYPFLSWDHDLVNAYLSKLGFYYGYDVVPATGLKYVALAEVYSYGRTVFEKEYLTIELVNLDTIANNTILPKIVLEVLDGKLVSGEKKLSYVEYDEILDMFRSQQLLAGYNLNEAGRIIVEYYKEGKRSLVKEVARIVMSYDKIFEPYRTCYDMKKWKEIDCWSIKLD